MFTVVRILSKDDHFDLVEGAHVECTEYICAPRVDLGVYVFIAYESRKFFEIGLTKLFGEHFLPGRFDLY